MAGITLGIGSLQRYGGRINSLTRAIVAAFLPLDAIAPAAAAFSLRRLRTAYSGPLVRVRRSSDNVEADIGFTSAGDLDLDALTAHCQAPRRPLTAMSVSAAAAYSLRLIRAAYSGPAIRVRRSNDNVEADIGFDANGNLDTTSLLAFTGANTGFVTTWYDQSGNGRNAAQASVANQPRIVNAGTVETLGSRPCVRFINASATSLIATGPGVVSGLTVSAVHAWDATEPNFSTLVTRNASWQAGTWQLLRANALNRLQLSQNGSADVPSTTDYTANTATIATANFATAGSLFQNGTSSATGTLGASQTADTIAIGAWIGSRAFNGRMTEVVLFSPVLSATDRALLEQSQAAYYGITYATTLPSGFVTTWYDQSGNARNATQATAANQPRIVNAGAVDTYAGTTRPCVRVTANGQGLNVAALNGVSVTIGSASHVWADSGARAFSTPSYLHGPWWHGNDTATSAFTTAFSNAAYVNGTHFGNGNAFTMAAPGANGNKQNTCRVVTLMPTGPVTLTTTAAALLNDLRAGLDGRWVDAGWEIIYFPSVLSTADRQSLERNQGTYFGITVA